MERLTARWGNNQAVPRKFDLADVFDVSKTTWEELTNIFNKLASYEGTELTPDAVEQMQKENAELKELLRLAVEDMYSDNIQDCKTCIYLSSRNPKCPQNCNVCVWEWQHADRAREVGVEV